jgi:hypothetical protein
LCIIYLYSLSTRLDVLVDEYVENMKTKEDEKCKENGSGNISCSLVNAKLTGHTNVSKSGSGTISKQTGRNYILSWFYTYISIVIQLAATQKHHIMFCVALNVFLSVYTFIHLTGQLY